MNDALTTKKNTAPVLEFCTDLARKMILAGANLERVDLAISLVCHAYGLEDVSIFLLSSHISLSARDRSGNYVSRQLTIPASGIHLERLKRLNRLSYKVVNETPEADKLGSMLDEAWNAEEYKGGVILAARTFAMICLCLMFGGGVAEVICTAAITIALHFVGKLMARADINRLVGSSLTMGIAAIAVMLLYTAGILNRAPVVLITLIMIFLPGIPLVNAVRNLLCDHQMNGVLQLMKVLVETAFLAAGIYIAVFIFKGGSGFGSLTDFSRSDPLLLILLSFGSCIGFAVTFQIPPHDLWRAGIGGVLTRIVLILAPRAIPYTLAYTGLAALAAALYAEFLASKRKDPSTYFVYPAIIPLIPGGSFFNMIIGLLYHDWSMALTNGYSCLLTLLGMSLGFVISSSIAHYIRKWKRDIHIIKKGVNRDGSF